MPTAADLNQGYHARNNIAGRVKNSAELAVFPQAGREMKNLVSLFRLHSKPFDAEQGPMTF
jgi:hypothetical protein